jgi:hypothetical protein
MKNESYRYRSMPLSKSVENRHPNLVGLPCPNKKRSARAKTICIITQMTALPATNMPGKKMRRILIFDNHPDSLRLAVREQANTGIDSAKTWANSWHIIIVSLVAAGGLLGMFLITLLSGCIPSS